MNEILIGVDAGTSVCKAVAFSAGVLPTIAENGCVGRPASSGVTSNSRTAPFSIAATQLLPVIVSSSVPSLPCTSHAACDPNSLSTSAMGRVRSRM